MDDKNELEWIDAFNSDIEAREQANIEYLDYINNQDKDTGKPSLTLRQSIVTNIEQKSIVLSASLIKRFLWKGNDKDHCPKRIYKEFFLKEWKQTTLSQAKGLLFESLCIGGSADGSITLDLPRKKPKKGEKIGAKSIDQERIEEQALVFKQIYSQYGVIVKEKGDHKNVQKEFCVEWKDPKYHNYDDYKIYIQGTLDIISPIKFGSYEYPMAIIDLKLTQNRNSTFGEYGWGNAQDMDHIQAFTYNYALGYPFVYWVWDYQSNDEERGHKFVPVKPFGTDEESQTRLNEFHQAIRRCVQLILQYDAEGWPCNGKSYNVCKDCLGNPKNGGECTECNNIQEV